MFQQSKPVRTGSHYDTKSWQVDIELIASSVDWLINARDLTGRNGAKKLLITDLEEMGRYFKHWYLAASDGHNIKACPDDGEAIVPACGQWRCLNCGLTMPVQTNLAWLGFLPLSVTGKDRVISKIREKIANGTFPYQYLDKPEGFYIFPSMRIFYPQNWPNSKPAAFYDRYFFEVLGRSSDVFGGTHHMLGGNQLCLFLNWRKMSIMAVIRDRILPHMVAQVQLANGETPGRWYNRE